MTKEVTQEVCTAHLGGTRVNTHARCDALTPRMRSGRRVREEFPGGAAPREERRESPAWRQGERAFQTEGADGRQGSGC